MFLTFKYVQVWVAPVPYELNFCQCHIKAHIGKSFIPNIVIFGLKIRKVWISKSYIANSDNFKKYYISQKRQIFLDIFIICIPQVDIKSKKALKNVSLFKIKKVVSTSGIIGSAICLKI